MKIFPVFLYFFCFFSHNLVYLFKLIRNCVYFDMRIIIFSIISVILLTFTSFAGNLLNCPDCGREISERAVMCPYCGCPGYAIAEAAKQKHAAERARKPHPVIKIKTDNASGFAVPVKDNGKTFLLLNYDLLDGLTSLSFSLLTTNTSVKYLTIEPADNFPLARLATPAATNILFVSLPGNISTQSMPTAWLTTDAENNCLYTGKIEIAGNQLLNVPENIKLIAAIDSSTNLIGLVTEQNNNLILQRIPKDINWIQIKPMEYRRQTQLLMKAEKSNKLSKELKKELENTKWLTTTLQKRCNLMINSQKRRK